MTDAIQDYHEYAIESCDCHGHGDLPAWAYERVDGVVRCAECQTVPPEMPPGVPLDATVVLRVTHDYTDLEQRVYRVVLFPDEVSDDD